MDFTAPGAIVYYECCKQIIYIKKMLPEILYVTLVHQNCWDSSKSGWLFAQKWKLIGINWDID